MIQISAYVPSYDCSENGPHWLVIPVAVGSVAFAVLNMFRDERMWIESGSEFEALRTPVLPRTIDEFVNGLSATMIIVQAMP